MVMSAPESKASGSRSSLLHERLARTKAHRRWTAATSTTTSSNPSSPTESANMAKNKVPTSPREKIEALAEHHLSQRKSVSSTVAALASAAESKPETAASARETASPQPTTTSQTLNYRRRRMLQRRRGSSQSPATISDDLVVSASMSDAKSTDQDGKNNNKNAITRTGSGYKSVTGKAAASPRVLSPTTSPKWAVKEKNRTSQEEEREPPLTPPTDEAQPPKSEPAVVAKRASWMKNSTTTTKKSTLQQQPEQTKVAPWVKERVRQRSPPPPPPPNPPTPSPKRKGSASKFVFKEYGSSREVEPTNNFKAKEGDEQAQVETEDEPPVVSKVANKSAATPRGRSATSWIKQQQRSDSFDFSLTESEQSASEPSVASWQARDRVKQHNSVQQSSKAPTRVPRDPTPRNSQLDSEGPSSPSWKRQQQQQQEKVGSAPTSPRASWGQQRREPSPVSSYTQSESEPSSSAPPPPWARQQSKPRASPSTSSLSESEPSSNARPPWARQQSKPRVSPAPSYSFSESDPSSATPQSAPWSRHQQSKSRVSPAPTYSFSESDPSSSGPQPAPWLKQHQQRPGRVSPSSDEFCLSESEPSSTAQWPPPKARASPTSSASSQNQRPPWVEREPSPSVSQFTENDTDSSSGAPVHQHEQTSGPDWRRQLSKVKPPPPPPPPPGQPPGKAPWVRSAASWIKPTADQDHEEEYHDDEDDNVVVEEKKISEPSLPVSPQRSKPLKTAAWKRPPAVNTSYNASRPSSYSATTPQQRHPPDSPASSFVGPSDEGGGTKKPPEWLIGPTLDSKPSASVPAWKQKLLKKVKAEKEPSRPEEIEQVSEQADTGAPLEGSHESTDPRATKQRSWQRNPPPDQGPGTSGKNAIGKAEVVKPPSAKVKAAAPRPVKAPAWVKRQPADGSTPTMVLTENASPPVQPAWQRGPSFDESARGSEKLGKHKDFGSPPKPKPKQPSWVKQRTGEGPEDEIAAKQASPTWKRKGQGAEGVIKNSPTPSWKRLGGARTQGVPAQSASPRRNVPAQLASPRRNKGDRQLPPSPARMNRKSWIKSEQADDNEDIDKASEVSSTIETPMPQSVAALRASLQSKGGKVPSPADPTPVVGRVARSQIVGGRPISVTTSATARSPSPVMRKLADRTAALDRDDESWLRRRSKWDNEEPSNKPPLTMDNWNEEPAQEQSLGWDGFGEGENSDGEEATQEEPSSKWDEFDGVESPNQPSEWEMFGEDEEPSKRSMTWESFQLDSDMTQRTFSSQWEGEDRVMISPPSSQLDGFPPSRPSSSNTMQFAPTLQSPVTMGDPIVTPTQPQRQVSIDSPAPPPPPPSTPLTQEKVSARQLWKNKKLGANKVFSLPKPKDDRFSQPKSIAEGSHEDSLTMISMGSETASEIEDRANFSRLLQMEFANDLEPTIEEDSDDKRSPTLQEQERPDEETEQDSFDGTNKSLQEMAADSVLIADFHQFRKHMERNVNNEDGSLLSSSPARSADATPSKSDLPYEFQSILGDPVEPDHDASPQLQAAEGEMDFFDDDVEPSILPIRKNEDEAADEPDLKPNSSDGTTSSTKSEAAIAPTPYNLSQAVLENIRLSKRAVQASKSEREAEGSEAGSSVIFGDPDSFGAAGGDDEGNVNVTPNIMDRARAIEQWNGGRSPPRPRRPLEIPSRPFDERVQDDDDCDDRENQQGSKAVRWSREPNQVQLLDSDDSPSSEGDEEPMDPLAGSFPMEASASGSAALRDTPREPGSPFHPEEGGDFGENETEVSAQWHDRDPEVDVVGDVSIPESPSPEVLQTADTADSSEWHISPMISGVDSSNGSPPNVPETSEKQQPLRPALHKPNSPIRATKKVSFVDGDVSPSRKGDNARSTDVEDDPFAFPTDPFRPSNMADPPARKDVFDPFGLEQGVEVSMEDSFAVVSSSVFAGRSFRGNDGMMDPNEAMSSPFKLLPPRSSPTNISRERRQREAAMDFMDTAHYDYSDVAVASSYDPYGEESFFEEEKSEI